jgi:hypothetical protein
VSAPSTTQFAGYRVEAVAGAEGWAEAHEA